MPITWLPGFSERIAEVFPYVLTFFALAVFPLALGGYGVHLATLALSENPKGRRKALIIVWGLASIGIVLFGVSQAVTYHADKLRDRNDRDFRFSVLNKLQSIIDEPDIAKKKEHAVALKKSIANVDDIAHRVIGRLPQPKASKETIHITTPVLQLAATGNLKQRTIELSDEIMEDLYRHGVPPNHRTRTSPILNLGPMPKTAEEESQWTQNRSVYFRMRFIERVLTIKDEFAQLHLRDQHIDDFFKYHKMAADSKGLKLSDPSMDHTGPIISLPEIEDISERLKTLAEQIK